MVTQRKRKRFSIAGAFRSMMGGLGGGRRRSARATGRAMALTGRSGRRGGMGIKVHAVKPRMGR